MAQRVHKVRAALLGSSLASALLLGCRAPWRLNKPAEPDFHELIDIEQRAAHQSISSSHRPGSSSAATLASSTEASSSGEGSGRNKVEGKSESSVPSREEQLLERISRAIQHANEPEAASDDRVVSAAASGSEGGGEAQPAVYHLSDGDTEKTTEQETTIRKKPRNRYVDEVPAALSTNDQEERDTNSAVVLASAKKVTGGSSDAVREPTLDEQPIPQRSAGDGAGEGGAVTGEAALKSATIRQLALALIDKLEGAAEQTSNPDEQVDYAKKRRLVNLVIDDLDGALQPIPDLQPEAQDYVAHTFQALYDATDINGNPVANRRWTLALRSHRTAENALAKLANLEVKNLAFCTEVLSFGVITKFPQYHFRPDQEVLLYCELENFVSQAVRGGYETQLQGSYEIVDAQGRRIADQILPEDTDFCGNQREDFYVAYRFHMPSRLEPGRHELRLTIEDMKGHKFGQGKIDFHVVR